MQMDIIEFRGYLDRLTVTGSPSCFHAIPVPWKQSLNQNFWCSACKKSIMLMHNILLIHSGLHALFKASPACVKLWLTHVEDPAVYTCDYVKLKRVFSVEVGQHYYSISSILCEGSLVRPVQLHYVLTCGSGKGGRPGISVWRRLFPV